MQLRIRQATLATPPAVLGVDFCCEGAYRAFNEDKLKLIASGPDKESKFEFLRVSIAKGRHKVMPPMKACPYCKAPITIVDVTNRKARNRASEVAGVKRN